MAAKKKAGSAKSKPTAKRSVSTKKRATRDLDAAGGQGPKGGKQKSWNPANF